MKGNCTDKSSTDQTEISHFCFHRALVSSNYQLKIPVLIRQTTSAETKTPRNQTKSRSQRVDGKIQQGLGRICAVICLIWRRSPSQRKHLLFRSLLLVSKLWEEVHKEALRDIQALKSRITSHIIITLLC